MAIPKAISILTLSGALALTAGYSKVARACSPIKKGLHHNLNDEGDDFDGLPANLPLAFRVYAHEVPLLAVKHELAVSVWSDLAEANLRGSLEWGVDGEWDDSISQTHVVWRPEVPFRPHDRLVITVEIDARALGGEAARHEVVQQEAFTREPVLVPSHSPGILETTLEGTPIDEGSRMCCETKEFPTSSCGNGSGHCVWYEQRLVPALSFRTEVTGPAIVRVHILDELGSSVAQNVDVIRAQRREVSGTINFPEPQAEYCLQLELVDMLTGTSSLGEPSCQPHADLELWSVTPPWTRITLFDKLSASCVGPVYTEQVGAFAGDDGPPDDDDQVGCRSPSEQPPAAGLGWWALVILGVGRRLRVGARRD